MLCYILISPLSTFLHIYIHSLQHQLHIIVQDWLPNSDNSGLCLCSVSHHV